MYSYNICNTWNTKYIVADDNTKKDFAESIFKGISTDDLKGLESEEYCGTLLERVTDILDDDISRTDID